jgi:hypothetical protein
MKESCNGKPDTVFFVLPCRHDEQNKKLIAPADHNMSPNLTPSSFTVNRLPDTCTLLHEEQAVSPAFCAAHVAILQWAATAAKRPGCQIFTNDCLLEADSPTLPQKKPFCECCQ